jgi:hypothetical protein
VSLYMQQASNLYLAVVHIWDKIYGFPLVPQRDPMSDHCMIDDPIGVLEYDWGSAIDGANEDSSPIVLPTPFRHSRKSIKIFKEGKRYGIHFTGDECRTA